MKNGPEKLSTPEGTGITPKQQRAIEALLAGRTKIEAAQAAGVTDRTLRYWFNNPTFRAALTHAANHPPIGTPDPAASLTRLTQIMNDKKATPADRLRAVAHIIRHLDLAQQQERLDRITNLESQFNLEP
jgi:hypothetical protein